MKENKSFEDLAKPTFYYKLTLSNCDLKDLAKKKMIQTWKKINSLFFSFLVSLHNLLSLSLFLSTIFSLCLFPQPLYVSLFLFTTFYLSSSLSLHNLLSLSSQPSISLSLHNLLSLFLFTTFYLSFSSQFSISLSLHKLLFFSPTLLMYNSIYLSLFFNQ